MKFFLTVLLFLAPVFVDAAEVVEQVNSFDIDVWDDVATSRTYYGELNHFPHTFKFFIEEPTTLIYEVGARKQKDQVSILLVKEKDRGVAEVSRLTPILASTTKDRMWQLGLSFWKYDTEEIELKPGTYRLEVSTPENYSKYYLKMGREAGGSNILQMYADLFQTQSFFGTWLGSVRSPLIFVPLILCFIGWRIFRKNKYA